MRRRIIYLIFAAFLTLPNLYPAQAQTEFTFTADPSGDWSVPGNWSPSGGPPTAPPTEP